MVDWQLAFRQREMYPRGDKCFVGGFFVKLSFTVLYGSEAYFFRSCWSCRTTNAHCQARIHASGNILHSFSQIPKPSYSLSLLVNSHPVKYTGIETCSAQSWVQSRLEPCTSLIDRRTALSVTATRRNPHVYRGQNDDRPADWTSAGTTRVPISPTHDFPAKHELHGLTDVWRINGLALCAREISPLYTRALSIITCCSENET